MRRPRCTAHLVSPPAQLEECLRKWQGECLHNGLPLSVPAHVDLRILLCFTALVCDLIGDYSSLLLGIDSVSENLNISSAMMQESREGHATGCVKHCWHATCLVIAPPQVFRARVLADGAERLRLHDGIMDVGLGQGACKFQETLVISGRVISCTYHHGGGPFSHCLEQEIYQLYQPREAGI